MSHFYDENGNSCHEVVVKTGKNAGKMRPSTIADAKKNNWYPSATTILDIISKKGLDDWKQNQVALAARKLLGNGTVPYNLADDAYCGAVKQAAFEQVNDAADLGTAVHKALEEGLQGKEYDKTYAIYVEAVRELLKDNRIYINEHELRLVNKDFKYAGTTDGTFTATRELGDIYGIIDFKTCKTKPEKPVETRDTWVQQIAAYHVAKFKEMPSLNNTSIAGINIAISTTEPGRVEMIWHFPDDLEKAWRLFYHACNYYLIKNDYQTPNDSIPVQT